MLLHRIVLARFSLQASDAFSGRGGLHGKGRWHTPGRPIVYAAEHRSLAMAGSLVHIQRSNSIEPFNHYAIDVPDSCVLPVASLPAGWSHNVEATQALGDAWLAAGSSVGLLVPSAVVAGEKNCLLNPAHPHFRLSWVLSGPTPFSFDARLTKP